MGNGMSSLQDRSILWRRLWRLYLCAAGAQTLFAVAWKIYRWRWCLRAWRHLPAFRAEATPVMGHLGGYAENQLTRHEWYRQHAQGLPNCVYHKLMGDMPNLLLMDPRLIRHVLKDASEKYSKPHRDEVMTFVVQTFLGRGIFTEQHGVGAPDGGARWLLHRKRFVSVMSRNNLAGNMQEVFAAKARQLSAALRAGQALDLQRAFFNYTMDVSMRVFCGEACDLLGGEEVPFCQQFDRCNALAFDCFVASFVTCIVFDVLPWPFGGIRGLLARLQRRFSPCWQELFAGRRQLSGFCAGIVAKCRADPRLDERTDLLALFMQGGQGDRELTDTELVDAVLNILIAARDTTACLLSWMFYVLATHPELQHRVAEEVARTHPEGAEPSWSSVAARNVPLLHGLLYETLRLYPPVPGNFKEAQADDTLPDGTRVRRGVQVEYLAYSLGRDPERYPAPTEVRPERWIPFSQPDPCEFPVFQAGPRICLGMDAAVFEAKVVAVTLLREWSFGLKPGEAEKIRLGASITMSVCNSEDHSTSCLWMIPKRLSAES